jgi:hypothetical protein
LSGIPVSIRVGYRDYAVVEISAIRSEAEAAYGRHSSLVCEIEVRTDTKPHETVDTLLHEVLHAAWSVAGLNSKDGEERVVTALAHQLTQIWRDNPDLVAYLSEALRP